MFLRLSTTSINTRQITHIDPDGPTHCRVYFPGGGYITVGQSRDELVGLIAKLERGAQS